MKKILLVDDDSNYRKDGFLKNGFAVSCHRTAGTRAPDYSTNTGLHGNYRKELIDVEKEALCYASFLLYWLYFSNNCMRKYKYREL